MRGDQMIKIKSQMLFAGFVLSISSQGIANEKNVAYEYFNGSTLTFDYKGNFSNANIIVSGPNGFKTSTFQKSGEPTINLSENTLNSSPTLQTSSSEFSGANSLEDGSYKYEITVATNKKVKIVDTINNGRGKNNQITANLSETQSGHFRVKNGSIVTDQAGIQSNSVLADQVILDDLIVDGSTCIGMDCVNGESFGFDTLRLKENNLRIKAQDTSASASFPTNDWQITFNDSSNGGQNKFSIDDIDGGRTPFTIEAGAPSHSLYVDDGGRLGLGTSTPTTDIHSKSGNTPTMRLEQDGSSGFASQTWDVAGNEANFFIRDATNGSTLPFRIRPGAPSNALDISANGNVGIGKASASASLHVQRSDGTAKLLIEEISPTVSLRNVLKLKNNGSVGFELEDSDLGNAWDFRTATNGGFLVSNIGVAGSKFQINTDGAVFMNGTKFHLNSAGNMTVAGTSTAVSHISSSSRSVKKDFANIDETEVMDKIKKLQITQWRYKDEAAKGKHVGPMAEEFYSLFGLGPDEKHVAATDMASIAIIAAKELQKKSDVITAENKALKHQGRVLANKNDQLQKRLTSLEELVSKLVASNNPKMGPKVVLMKN
ncbi:hypothetical protein GQR58_029846 [Nymphon striatum]|nr:hypothetical protein GQR58_029846 [Nymphon striatum]